MLNKTRIVASLAAAVMMGIAAQAMADDQIDNAALTASSEPSREQVVEIILGTWESHLELEEVERLETVLSAADTANLRSAMDVLDYDSMIAALSGAPVTKGEDGWNILELGDANQDLVYTPIEPCRIVDTRMPSSRGGPIGADSARSFYSWVGNFGSMQGGDDSNCGIPPSPAALAINVTAVNPDRDGYLTVYPAETTTPNASSLNYESGDIVGNEVVGVMRQGAGLGFQVYTWGQTHVVVDAVGYFLPAVATPLDCQSESLAYEVAAGGQGTENVSCPTGFSATGGGCAGVLQGLVRSSQPSGNGWFCRTENESASAATHRAHVNCCRVPGR